MDSRKAMTSCFVTRSNASMRAGLMRALALICLTADGGISPFFARASQARSSTLSQVSYLRVGSQIAFRRGLAYRSIMSHRRDGLPRFALQAGVLAKDAVQDAVDEGSRLLVAEQLHDLDGFVERDAGRNVRQVQEFIDRHSQDGPICDRHPVNGPVLGVAAEQSVQFVCVGDDPVDEAFGKGLGLRMCRVLRPEVLQPAGRAAMDIPLVQDLEGQLASLAAQAHRDLFREGRCLERPGRRFIRLAISIAETPASYPLLTPPTAERACACSSVSVVSTPKMTGKP